MNRFRLRDFVLGLLIAVSVGVAADSVIPSRLRLQSLGVGVSAPLTNGDAIVNGTLTATAATVGGSSVCRVDGVGCPTQAQVSCPGPCNGSAIVVGQTYVISKASDTTRASTATLADDSELIISSLPIGGYEVFLHWTLDAIDGNGSRAGIRVAGVPSDEANGNGISVCNGAASVVSSLQFTTTSTLGSCASADDFSGYNSLHFNATSTGAVAMQWAQSSSGANGTVLRRRANMTVRRIY